jgi:hypothetical protein
MRKKSRDSSKQLKISQELSLLTNKHIEYESTVNKKRRGNGTRVCHNLIRKPSLLLHITIMQKASDDFFYRWKPG